ncbi:MAG: hypothetical protein JNM81_03505 [Rhodospirillaceae bacterium]|nr:hypothetical protein [Rhodospirillaceae bacterium]
MAKPKKSAPAKAEVAKAEVAKTEAHARTLDDIDASRGPKRVKALRDKFEKALENPDTREAMARYLQHLLRQDKNPR